MAKRHPKSPVLAVLNLKGGVGKTTICAHLSLVLFAHIRKSIQIIDLDPQFNLTQQLFKRARYEKLKEENKTIYSVMEPPPPGGLFHIDNSPKPPPDPSEVGIALKYLPRTDPLEELIVVPGDFSLVKYSLMDDNSQLTNVKKRFFEFIENSRKKYGLVILDCNPGSSFLTLCAIESCTHILVPVRPDRYSVLGLEILTQFINSVPSLPRKPKVIVVLNGIPRTGYIPLVENELRVHKDFGSMTLAARVYNSGLLEADPGYTGFATDKPVAWRWTLYGELKTVAKELASRLGIKK